MKKILLSLILLTIITISCASDDNNNKCDHVWKVKEWCKPKVSGIVGCQTPNILEKRFCDDDLIGVTPGKIVMYQEDNYVKRYREYIKEIK